MKKKICKVCGKEFEGTKNQKLCSKECKKISKVIPSLVKYFGFDINAIGTDKCFEEVEKIKNELNNLYWNKHLSSSDICKMYNYPNVSNLTGKIFKYLNIQSKTPKESVIENWLNNKMKPFLGNIHYNQQWHTTWNGKEVYLRSSFEVDYAKELDEQKIEYDVEALRIKYFNTKENEYRCAIPDFYIPSKNMIIEIKSNWTLDEQEMKDKIKAYKELGYKFKLICDHKEIQL